jgi:hypothetical protein
MRKLMVALILAVVMIVGSASTVFAATFPNSNWGSCMALTVQGQSNGRVYAIQDVLRVHGGGVTSPGPYDGIFGSGTYSSVRSFQYKYGLTVDGKVGQNTWTKLRHYCAEDNSHPTSKSFSIYNAAMRLANSFRFVQSSAGKWKATNKNDDWIAMN